MDSHLKNSATTRVLYENTLKFQVTVRNFYHKNTYYFLNTTFLDSVDLEV